MTLTFSSNEARRQVTVLVSFRFFELEHAWLVLPLGSRELFCLKVYLELFTGMQR